MLVLYEYITFIHSSYFPNLSRILSFTLSFQSNLLSAEHIDFKLDLKIKDFFLNNLQSTVISIELTALIPYQIFNVFFVRFRQWRERYW